VERDEEDDETDSLEQDEAILAAVDDDHAWRDQNRRHPGVSFRRARNPRRAPGTESLRKHHPHGCEILPLYSRSRRRDQERVFNGRAEAAHRAGHQRGRNFA
jgi:hypothetical protein